MYLTEMSKSEGNEWNHVEPLDVTSLSKVNSFLIECDDRKLKAVSVKKLLLLTKKNNK